MCKHNFEAIGVYDQATKSVWWMPWHQAPKKDAISCDNLREAAHELRSVGFRMRELTVFNQTVSDTRIHSVRRGTMGIETSQYHEEEKEKSISLVVVSERERAQTVGGNTGGVRTDITYKSSQLKMAGKPHETG